MKKPVYLTLIRYKSWRAVFGFISMALFRLPLIFNKHIHFYKLMGCGKNGTFDIHPDWHQWAIFSVNDEVNNLSNQKDLLKALYGSFISLYLNFFSSETYCICLEPVKAHGFWDKKNPFFINDPTNANDQGPIAILTRATLRPNRLANFWKHVSPVAEIMRTSDGYLFSVGIGEVPWIKQATFSVWKNEWSMRQFAYVDPIHKEVIHKTRKERWYSEEMFVRFRILKTSGTMKGIDPLAIML